MRRILPLVYCLIVLLAWPGLAQEEPSVDPTQSDATTSPTEPDVEAAAESDDESTPGFSPGVALPVAEPEATQRIVFSLPFPAEKGGGMATGKAGNLDYLQDDYVLATGSVEFDYQSVKLQAQQVSIDVQSKRVTAEGNVILDDGPRRITGERMEYDLETKTGIFYEAEAFVDPDVFFSGAEISKLGEQIYKVKDGTITSCSEDKVPDWSFRLGEARINLDGFAKTKNTTMRVKKLPMLYSPFMMFPAKRGRVAGFLFPQFGYSKARGTVLGLAYFQPMGNSYDATIYADLYGENYSGLGAEFRYRPSHATQGTVQAFAIDDPIEDTVRWKASWSHTSNQLPFGMRGLVNFQDFSDFDFFRDFERNFNRITIRSLYSTGFASGNWGAHSLNIMADQRETFINNNNLVTQRQLPEIEYRLRPLQLGKLPIYLELLTSLNRFEIERTDVLGAQYSRADFNPRLTLPVSYWPWLSFSFSLASRTTWYEDSLTPDQSAYSGESLTRSFPSATAEVIGPSFSKVFEKKIGRFGKFKHIIEPRVEYLFVDEFEDQELVPLFDEVDTLSDRTTVGFTLINRLLGKPHDEESLEGAREVLAFEIGQAFSLREERPFQRSSDGEVTTTDGPIEARLRFSPGLRVNFEAQARYNTLFSALEQATLFGGMRFGDHGIGLSWVASRSAELDETRSHQVRLSTDFAVIRNHLRWQSAIAYDFVEGFMQQHRHILYYTAQCWGLRFEYRDFQNLNRKDEDIRLAISLKNIGTFLDLGHGIDDEP